MTEQEKALKKARKLYGTSAFTEDTINYKRIGFVKDKQIVTAIGDTWIQAFESIKEKL